VKRPRIVAVIRSAPRRMMLLRRWKRERRNKKRIKVESAIPKRTPRSFASQKRAKIRAIEVRIQSMEKAKQGKEESR